MSVSGQPLVWVGRPGEFIPGVPARTLTAEEADQHQHAIEQAQRFGRTLYVPAEPDPVEDEKETDDNG